MICSQKCRFIGQRVLDSDFLIAQHVSCHNTPLSIGCSAWPQGILSYTHQTLNTGHFSPSHCQLKRGCSTENKQSGDSCV